jgi:CheY-like chemotaxis protein
VTSYPSASERGHLGFLHHLPWRADDAEGPAGSLLGGNRILVVEDDEQDQILLKAAIEEEGGKPSVASSVIAAIRWTKRHDFDAGVFDFSLGKDDGAHLVERLIDTGKQFPVVFVSGVAKFTIGHFLRGWNVSDCLEKPIIKPDVVLALERAIVTDTRIRRPQMNFNFVDVNDLKQILHHLQPYFGKFPPEMQKEIENGRRALWGKIPDRERLHRFRQFLRHPSTRITLEHMSIGVAVRLLERWLVGG